MPGKAATPCRPYAVAVLATPANFDPTKSWPVLIPCSTSDFKRQNRNDLAQFYQRVGLAEGWVLLAGDGPQHAKNDNVAWRESMTLAAIDALTPELSGSGEVADGVRRDVSGEAKALVMLPFSCEKRLSHHRNLHDRRE